MIVFPLTVGIQKEVFGVKLNVTNQFTYKSCCFLISAVDTGLSLKPGLGHLGHSYVSVKPGLGHLGHGYVSVKSRLRHLGHWQTMQTQIRHCREQHLIRFYTIFLK